MQTNVENDQNKQNYSEQLIEYKKVEDTPFTIAKTEQGYTLLLGNYKISDKFYNTEDECLHNDLINENWHTIGKMIFAMIDLTKKIDSEKTEGIEK